jgi:hypothetical protein
MASFRTIASWENLMCFWSKAAGARLVAPNAMHNKLHTNIACMHYIPSVLKSRTVKSEGIFSMHTLVAAGGPSSKTPSRLCNRISATIPLQRKRA